MANSAAAIPLIPPELLAQVSSFLNVPGQAASQPDASESVAVVSTSNEISASESTLQGKVVFRVADISSIAVIIDLSRRLVTSSLVMTSKVVRYGLSKSLGILFISAPPPPPPPPKKTDIFDEIHYSMWVCLYICEGLSLVHVV